MRKRNELERMKMMRKDEERRREELVRLLWKLKNENKEKRHEKITNMMRRGGGKSW